MFKDGDGESELLLGNKQLLGIFFVLAVLFAVFFTAGYMVGRNSGDKKVADSTVGAKPVTPDAQATAGSGESHDVTPDPSASTDQPASTNSQQTQPVKSVAAGQSSKPARGVTPHEQLASKRSKTLEPAAKEEARGQEPVNEAPVAPGHSTYLQVAALSRPEADAVAKILSKKGFRTHIAPKLGTQWYRVLVGPMRDAGDLNATRDALKSKGFREVFVQHL